MFDFHRAETLNAFKVVYVSCDHRDARPLRRACNQHVAHNPYLLRGRFGVFAVPLNDAVKGVKRLARKPPIFACRNRQRARFLISPANAVKLFQSRIITRSGGEFLGNY